MHLIAEWSRAKWKIITSFFFLAFFLPFFLLTLYTFLFSSYIISFFVILFINCLYYVYIFPISSRRRSNTSTIFRYAILQAYFSHVCHTHIYITHTHTHTRTYVCTYLFTYFLTYIHLFTYTHAYIHTHAHTPDDFNIIETN